jgi:hypothetical protein
MSILIAEGWEYAFIDIQSILPVHKATQTPGCVSPSGRRMSREKAGEPIEVTLFF